jgi:glutathione peroxidase
MASSRILRPSRTVSLAAGEGRRHVGDHVGRVGDAAPVANAPRMAGTLEDVSLRRIDGSPTSLSAFDGKVKLIVNVASQCGLTPQYAGLQALYERYRDQGLVVLGFPANEFGAQEPGANADIAQFCETRFGVEFPMFEKVVVKGNDQHPLFAALTQAQPIGEGAGNDIRWNFEKFVVGRNGDVVGRFAPTAAPDDPALVSAIEAELAKP